METYIADEYGRIPLPGVQALYPPETHVFYQNGEYAGHESPIIEETTADTQPLPTLQGDQVEYVPVTQAEGA